MVERHDCSLDCKLWGTLRHRKVSSDSRSWPECYRKCKLTSFLFRNSVIQFSFMLSLDNVWIYLCLSHENFWIYVIFSITIEWSYGSDGFKSNRTFKRPSFSRVSRGRCQCSCKCKLSSRIICDYSLQLYLLLYNDNFMIYLLLIIVIWYLVLYMVEWHNCSLDCKFSRISRHRKVSSDSGSWPECKRWWGIVVANVYV